MYQWRKNNNWELVNCIGCGIEFNRRKNGKHPRTGLPTQYCSNKCSLSSSQKKEKLNKWALSDKNHFNKSEVQQKVRDTKKERYGNENYNNTFGDEYSGFRLLLSRAKNRKLKRCSITLDDLKEQWIIQDGKCIYSGIPLLLPKPMYNDKIRTASLDRIDSNRGYIKGNIQFISITLNLAKNGLTHEQMLDFCKIMKESYIIG
jgi:hypothetical protein